MIMSLSLKLRDNWKIINNFSKASHAIGPHGAGFANLVFCRPGTRVVEIGWNKKGEIEGNMNMDDMYYRLSDSLQLDYRLVIGNGSYTGAIDLDPKQILKLVQ